MGGHVDVLKWAHENGCPWDEGTCTWAASRGHLNVLKYAHENGCPWDERTCKYAAEGGHLDMLTYAHASFRWRELMAVIDRHTVIFHASARWFLLPKLS